MFYTARNCFFVNFGFNKRSKNEIEINKRFSNTALEIDFTAIGLRRDRPQGWKLENWIIYNNRNDFGLG